ncbi:MAG: hypothetical protein KJ674_05645 [Nanoarchaeota archaeon]|nr:hypothetical protein [Nanoarchaeota archaeon]
MPKQFTVKAEGLKPQLQELIARLKEHYVIIPTSDFIQHREDENCHIYLTVVEAP